MARVVFQTVTGVGASAPIPTNYHGLPQCSIQIMNPSGNTFTVQSAITRPGVDPVAADWINTADTAAVNATALALQTNYAFLPTHLRVNSTVGAGTVEIRVLQAGLANS